MTKALAAALQAVDDKKAHDVVVLDISEVSSFTDCFVLCTGTSSRQIQAIADAVEERTKAVGVRPSHIEGYLHAEWVLLDFMDFVVHIFSPTARAFYDLERLWRDGKRLEPAAVIEAADRPKKRSPRASVAGRKPAARKKPAGDVAR